MKQNIENMLGTSITDDQYKKALAMARAKQKYLIATFGDANGERRKEYYLQDLTYEAVVQNIYLDAMFIHSTIMKDMKKECPINEAP